MLFSLLNKHKVRQHSDTEDNTIPAEHLEIVLLDEAHQKQNSAVRTAARQKPVTKNLNNFERRSYDMESLEEQLLKSN